MKRFTAYGFFIGAVLFLVFSCQKELSQETNTNTASYSLHNDSTLSCNPILVNGTYHNGVSAVSNTNYIQVVVNVKKTGNYNLSSSLSNGFTFKDSGFFSKTGVDTLTLKAKGAPILVQSTEFIISGNDSLGACNFFVDVQDSTGTGLGSGDTTGTGGNTDTTVTDTTSNVGYGTTYKDPTPATFGTWKFTDSTNNQSYSGTVFYAQADGLSGEQEMRLTGDIDNGHQFYLQIATNKSAFTIGSYRFHDDQTNQVTYTSTDATADGYNALGNLADKESTDPSYINVTSYDTNTGEMKGSFRSWAIKSNDDGSLKTVVLIKGSFDCKVN